MKCGDKAQNLLCCEPCGQFNSSQNGGGQREKKERKRIPSVEVVRKLKGPKRKRCGCEKSSDAGTSREVANKKQDENVNQRNAARIIITAGDETKVALNLILREVADGEQAGPRENRIEVEELGSSDEGTQGSTRLMGNEVAAAALKTQPSGSFSTTVVAAEVTTEMPRVAQKQRNAPCDSRLGTCCAMLKKSRQDSHKSRDQSQGDTHITEVKSSENLSIIGTVIGKQSSGAIVVSSVLVQKSSETSYTTAVNVEKEPGIYAPMEIKSSRAITCERTTCREKKAITGASPSVSKRTGVATEGKGKEPLTVSQIMAPLKPSGAIMKPGFVVEKASETSFISAQVVVEKQPSGVLSATAIYHEQSSVSSYESAGGTQKPVKGVPCGIKHGVCPTSLSVTSGRYKADICDEPACQEKLLHIAASPLTGSISSSKLSQTRIHQQASGTSATVGVIVKKVSERSFRIVEQQHSALSTTSADSGESDGSVEFQGTLNEMIPSGATIRTLECPECLRTKQPSPSANTKCARLEPECEQMLGTPMQMKASGATRRRVSESQLPKSHSARLGAKVKVSSKEIIFAVASDHRSVEVISSQASILSIVQPSAASHSDNALQNVSSQRSNAIESASHTHTLGLDNQGGTEGQQSPDNVISIQVSIGDPPPGRARRAVDEHRKVPWWIFLVILILIIPLFMIIGAVLGLALCHPMPCSYHWPFSPNSILSTIFLSHSKDSVRLRGAF